MEVRSLCLLSYRGEWQRLEQYLCSSERDRAARFRFQADFERFVVARSYLRLQLGSYLACDPTSLRFQYTSCGKPFLEGAGIEFNVSHSGDWVLFAFAAGGEVGVDIEKIKPMRGTPMADVARRCFSAAESAKWEATPEADRVEAFYRCWTRKEAYIKAIGEGLSCPLDRFEVAFELGQPACLTSIEGDKDRAAAWFMADLPGFPGYCAAVAARPENLAQTRLEVRSLSEVTMTEALS